MALLRIGVLVAVALSSIAAGCREGARGDAPSTSIVGATEQEHALLRDLLRRLEGSEIEEIRYFHTSYLHEEEGHPVAWLTFVFPADPRLWTRTSWEALLIAGGMRDRRESGIRPIGGVSFKQRTDDGRMLGAGGNSFPLQPERSPHFARTDAVEDVIRRNARLRYATTPDIDVVALEGPAPLITLRVTSLREYRRYAPYDPSLVLGSLIDSERPQVDGFYFEIKLGDKLLDASAFARRVDIGTSWTDPSVRRSTLGRP